ncbi:DUF7344 domain-containing protein [Halomontanus rarus]|uniref:DUF7344 domain-containing protein n=1 Tax=Halomontanus rarus TaxID=3034020 RepID=UPI001A97EE20|nr:hypothetical protein [Halovivax sp. TS33]
MTHSIHDIPGADELTTSDRYRLLAEKRRRMTLDVLTGQNVPVDLTELATGIAAREDGTGAVDEETVTRVALTLHHVHLPMLAEYGVIDYNPDTNCVESCPLRFDPRIE